ncbi:MAG: hypothetical protein KF787_00250 [Phycisphaeraceae bacterium]|nr:hypothetical protein [Phycisphaerae bacterium]MBX3391054.1 hypothetical protein [Phycisphaeraceae bacterium]
MNTRELLELAQLDAMGLLDEQDAREFEVAFAAAGPEIQEQIRKEQSRLCVIEPVLPDVRPPEHLRGKVLAAVHGAIVESITAPAPAGTGATTAVAARFEEHAQEEPATSVAAAVRHSAGRDLAMPGDPGRRRTARLWRISTFAFAAASVVLGITTISLQSEYERVINQKVTSESLERVTALFGMNTHDFFFADQTQRTVLHPVGESASDPRWMNVRAAVWHSADWSSVKLLCENLPSANGERYQLVAISEEGETRVIGDSLEPTQGGLMAFSIRNSFSPATERLALRAVVGSTTVAILESGRLLG